MDRRHEQEPVAASSAAAATPSLNVAKKGLANTIERACGVRIPRVRVCRWVSMRATGCGR